MYRILYENRDLFYESQENGNQAVKELPAIHTICHNDPDSKNVLWREKDFRIIDLEWLEYNIKRVLGIDCGADEKEIGISETRDTVAHIVYYKKAKRDIIDNLCKL